MLAQRLKRRIIPCLDVKNGVVVKGVKFRAHETIGDIIALGKFYAEQGADELVFYDITASSENRTLEYQWVREIAAEINIPFCAAGGIKSISDAEKILAQGADKISINSFAIENPNLIDELAKRFGSQCIVIGIDSLKCQEHFRVCQYTGNEAKTVVTERSTLMWAREVQSRGAGEIVLNCMDQDGMRQGYDIEQLQALSEALTIPVIASGGAGAKEHFLDVFRDTDVTGALAATVFHKQHIIISELKRYLADNQVEVRL